MPHARHGGIGVCAFAATGSKLVSIGLEKEQIGQIQVAFLTAFEAAAAIADTGLPRLGDGVLGGLSGLKLPTDPVSCIARELRVGCFG